MKKVSELSKEEEQRALDIYRKSIIVDGVILPRGNMTPEFVGRLQNSGITCAVAHMHDSQGGLAFDYAEGIKVTYEHLAWIEGSPDKTILINTADDIEQAKKEGKTSLTLGIHNARSIEAFLEPTKSPSTMMIPIMKKLGVRLIGLTRHDRNWLADGCNERTDSGLSNYGVRCVEEMNKVGIVIDLAHVGKKSSLETIEVSKDPCVFTHANSINVSPNPRNKTDDEIKALAEKGGVICITGLAFCSYTKYGVRPTIDDLLTHINYAVNLVGVDHVGIGSDNGEGMRGKHPKGPSSWPEIELPFTKTSPDAVAMEGFSKVEQWVNVARVLVAGGYSDQEIQKILGGNLLKIFKKVWKK